MISSITLLKSRHVIIDIRGHESKRNIMFEVVLAGRIHHVLLKGQE